MLKSIIIFVALVALAAEGYIINQEVDQPYDESTVAEVLNIDGETDETEVKPVQEETELDVETDSEHDTSEAETEDFSDNTEDASNDVVLNPEEFVMVKKNPHCKSLEYNPKDVQEAEAEIKDWIRNLNCFNAPMSFITCTLIKNASEDYYSNPDRDPTSMITTLKYIVPKLKKSKRADPQLNILLEKYEPYLHKTVC